jgi:hypothetical protein
MPDQNQMHSYQVNPGAILFITVTLTGSLRLLFLYDVAEEIRLDKLRKQLGAQTRPPSSFRHPAPGYVRFSAPPIVQELQPLELASGERPAARLSYYEYGVIGLEIEIPFEFDWNGLVQLAARWIASGELERLAQSTVRGAVRPFEAHFVKPYPDWLVEDYCIVHVLSQPSIPAAELIANHGSEISCIVRGETAVLAPERQADTLEAGLSYYPNDLLVVGWSAAFLYDSIEGAAPTIELLKYANTQLLDFRHYDEFLSRILAGVYKKLEARRGPLMRWRLASHAEKLNTVLLDIRQLTERMDNSVKFLSDMFDARLYRLAAARVGVPDYRKLVEEKLHTAGELYRFMVDQFQHARAFLLELTVVVILLIELYYFFQGKH